MHLTSLVKKVISYLQNDIIIHFTSSLGHLEIFNNNAILQFLVFIHLFQYGFFYQNT